jgi:hypothetical protein
MKKYLVEFTETDNTSYVFEFITDNIEKSIIDYKKIKPVKDYKILTEDIQQSKQILFG